MSRFTRRLFARPSALSGAARTMDLGATFNSYVVSASPEEADLDAMAADFLATAEDFRLVAARAAERHRAAIG